MAKAADKSGAEDTLYIGIDFGTSRTKISCSNGVRKVVTTAVGWPKDVIAAKFLGKNVVFGEEVLKHRMSLDVVHPLENGVIPPEEEGKKKKSRNTRTEAAKALMEHMISLSEPAGYKNVYGVLLTPAEASLEEKQALIDVFGKNLDAILLVSAPFAVAYGMNRMENTLVVDIGGGTVDLCRIHGTLPVPEDQKTLKKAGIHIDSTLLDLVTKEFEGAQISTNMVRLWKEEHSQVSGVRDSAKVTFPVNGSPQDSDISDQIRQACEGIVPDMVESIRELVSTFNPEFQHLLRENVLLAGGGSQIENLDNYLSDKLEIIGGARVVAVEDPTFLGADGALRLGQDMPDTYWQRLSES